MTNLSTLPLTAQLRFVQDAWQREKAMRLRVLKGENQRLKLQEADDCLECLANIEKELRKQ